MIYQLANGQIPESLYGERASQQQEDSSTTDSDVFVPNGKSPFICFPAFIPFSVGKMTASKYMMRYYINASIPTIYNRSGNVSVPIFLPDQC